jgi:hypothetical protein
MTTKEQKDLRSYCAFLLNNYGFHFPPDDPIIPALYVIYMHMKTNNESNEALALQISEALSKTNPKEFHFHHPGEAWKFQMAGLFKWVLSGLAVLVLLLFGAWHWSRVHDVEAARAILETTGNMSNLFHRVQKNDNGTYFINFTISTGDSVRHFVEYEKLDRKTVRVYLGKESK